MEELTKITIKHYETELTISFPADSDINEFMDKIVYLAQGIYSKSLIENWICQTSKEIENE